MVNFEWEIGPRLEGEASSEADEAELRRLYCGVHWRTFYQIADNTSVKRLQSLEVG